MAKRVAKRLQVAEKKADTKSVFPDEVFELNCQASSFEFYPFPEPMLEGKVILIKKFFPDKISQALRSSFSSPGIMELHHQRGTKEYAERINDRLTTQNAEIAQILWARLLKCLEQDDYVMQELGFGQAKGLNPQIRAYRYEKGHRFAKHYDSSVVVQGIGSSHWTLLVYLSGGDDLIGGDTVFYAPHTGEATNIHPQPGLALLHKHGDDCLLHEAQAVSDGVKWVLRSDVVF
ncbi:LAQU0S01e10836g1_1 [Lachancea quebecensis]|uniref:LAQU0S01e10836g1_1 n=1 Tax=Lachancea quebecensis TaxID=1654605 RepID=A0A0N7MKW6_9SACH|nr:LAQU0S01e10836g1_1 [Lachancea quebecensis]